MHINVQRVLELRAKGLSYPVIAVRMGCSQSSAKRIVSENQQVPEGTSE